jgi:hypothetical protein
MVSVSVEASEQIEERLRRVIAAADFVTLDGIWCFEESPADRPPLLTADTLAVVFSFHFPDGLDNSGFVGWLATHLKARLGTGVFVVCGSNRARGGIYDYWGCPADLTSGAIEVIEGLRAG